MMNRPTRITIHCSATKPQFDVGVHEIREWHMDRGFSDVGYHYVIRRDGTVEKGRPAHRRGAHVQGHNTKNLGICLVGGVNQKGNAQANYTTDQWHALRLLVIELVGRYGIPLSNIQGHRDFPRVNKECPCFDVKEWLDNDLFPKPDMI